MIFLFFYVLQEPITNLTYKYNIRDSQKSISFSHIRPLGAAGALAVDICICFQNRKLDFCTIISFISGLEC